MKKVVMILFVLVVAVTLCPITGFAETMSNSGGMTPIPEPSTMLLLGAGLVGLVGITKKIKK